MAPFSAAAALTRHQLELQPRKLRIILIGGGHFYKSFGPRVGHTDTASDLQILHQTELEMLSVLIPFFRRVCVCVCVCEIELSVKGKQEHRMCDPLPPLT